jgi:hypothetical protein
MLHSITTKLTALPIVTSLLLFFAPIKLILILVGVAIIADTIFGIIKAKKLGQKITSRKLANVLYKMLIYQGAVLTFYVIDVAILGDFIMLAVSVPYALTKVVALVAVSIELFSIDESLRLFNKGKGFKYYFKQLINVVKDTKEDINQIK